MFYISIRSCSLSVVPCKNGRESEKTEGVVAGGRAGYGAGGDGRAVSICAQHKSTDRFN